MYKETVKPVGKTIFFIIGIVAAALLLICITDIAITHFKLPYRSPVSYTHLTLPTT